MLLSCDRLHCRPWDVDTDPTVTPFIWHLRAQIAMDAEREVQEWYWEKDEKRRRMLTPRAKRR